MNAQLLPGILIAMKCGILAFLVFIAIPRRRIELAGKDFNERSLEQLTIRNGIDERIAGHLETIADVAVQNRKDSLK